MPIVNVQAAINVDQIVNVQNVHQKKAKHVTVVQVANVHHANVANARQNVNVIHAIVANVTMENVKFLDGEFITRV